MLISHDADRVFEKSYRSKYDDAASLSGSLRIGFWCYLWQYCNIPIPVKTKICDVEEIFAP